ncbi:GIY-YIG nuclease family protein, partial [Candidatus Gracilibacteria bacterium]|nr:GIY-YIG nuclease family protein [Candidatus Gracilibacteria bacterium]
MYQLYILKCADDTLYTGITNNLENRIKKHNGEIVGGAKYTRARRPVSLVYTEDFDDKSSALK